MINCVSGLLLTLLLGLGGAARAQPNPLVYPAGSPARRAAELCAQAVEFAQGSRRCQVLLDSATRVCPTQAWAWAELSVPYLKRGEFGRWYELLGRAVAVAPNEWLGYRAGCRFEMLRDYAGALRDLAQLRQLRPGQAYLGHVASGDYDLRVVQALSERATGQLAQSLATFAACLADNEPHQRVGLYEYLHYGVTLRQAGRRTEAEQALQRELAVYPKLADTYYYLGLLAEQAGDPARAQHYFEEALARYVRTGYHRQDPYCAMPDQVYLTDIQAKLK